MASYDDEDDLAYLQPGFDPASLTVARLRNILLTHGINYPSSSKKADLVETFYGELKPQARKILSAHRRTQRSSRGIENAASSTASTAESTISPEDELDVPRSAVKRGRGRPRKQPEPEEDEELMEAPPALSTRRATAQRTKSRPESKSIERNMDSSPPIARSVPNLKTEKSDPATWGRVTDDGPFSSDNPFQSGGSSPPQPPPNRRRKTDGAQEKETKRKSVTRRKTDRSRSRPDESTTELRRRVVNIPVSRLHLDDEVEAGEEFEPDEQAELDMELSKKRGASGVVIRRRRQSQTGSGWTRGVFAILLVFLVSFGHLWRQEKFNVGYCGVGQPSRRIAGVDLPEWADPIRPTCENCPQHAICYKDLVTDCENGFVLKQHPLSLGGLLPFPPSCEADGEKAKRVKAVADRIVDELRTHTAQAVCGDIEGSETSPSPEVKEEELKARVASKKRKGMSNEEFDNLWRDAIGEVIGREEIVSKYDELSGARTLASTSLVKVSFGCGVRRYVKLTMERYTKPAVGLLALIFALVATYRNWKTGQMMQAEAKRLTSQIYAKLSEYAQYDDTDGFASVNQLRDDVLRAEFSSSRRKKLWKRVEQLVEQNSNVRTKIGTLDSGDVGRGWKWIGSGGSRRGSSRYSLPVVASSPMTEVTGNVTPSGFTRWEDSSRPQY